MNTASGPAGRAPVIAAEALGKRYGTVQAVDGVDLQVYAGEIYALLGLNGAGKTTLIRMLLGMVQPSAGTVAVLETRIGPGVTGVWAKVGHLVAR
jgi:ABC-2 type transport system ATP-binding protein